VGEQKARQMVQSELLLIAFLRGGVPCAHGPGIIDQYLQAAKTFYPEGSFQTLQIDANQAQVLVMPSSEAPKIDVYAKAWLPGPIDLTKRFVWTVENQRLVLTEIPFEPAFFGFFPQPYEMTITAYVPQAVFLSYMGDGQ
jgi:hypothetical protein